MSHSYTIKITGLSFSASHFITFGRTRCEPIHGHNFRVEVIWKGRLAKHGYVVDFRRVRSAVVDILSALNDKLLLPTLNPAITINADRNQLRVDCAGRFVFEVPRSTCMLLEVENVTAERLAEYIATQLEKRIAGHQLPSPESLAVWVEEEPGCWAGFEKV